MARNFLKDEAKGVLRYCNCLNVKILESSVKMVNDEVEKNLHTNNEFFMGYDSKLRCELDCGLYICTQVFLRKLVIFKTRNSFILKVVNVKGKEKKKNFKEILNLRKL